MLSEREEAVAAYLAGCHMAGSDAGTLTATEAQAKRIFDRVAELVAQMMVADTTNGKDEA